MKISQDFKETVKLSLNLSSKHSRGNAVIGKVGIWLHNHLKVLAAPLLTLFFFSNVAFAATAEDAWNQVIGVLTTWVLRFGILVLVVGGIMLGLGFKNDDADGKTRGIATMIAGGIVTAVIGLAKALLTA